MPRSPEPSRIQLSTTRRAELREEFEEFYVGLFDEDLSAYRGDAVIDFFVRALGPAVYNQAIQDARKFVLEKLDDLDADLYEPE